MDDLTNPPVDWLRLQRVKSMPRSVSQAKEYLEELGGCAYKFFLHRVVRAWDRPAAWLPMGIAVHAAAEFWEKSGRKASLEEVIEVYKTVYTAETQRLLRATPNPNFWFASGKYQGPQDIVRRAEIGLEQVKKYYDYYVNQKPGEVIWITPKGEPAIELGFSVKFGSVEVRGYIDQILDEVVRDIKTGANPGDIFQLSVYRYAVLEEYGVDFTKGDYWMGKKGGPTKPYDLTGMSREQVTALFEKMDAGVKAEEFDPSPSPDKCRMCSVASACAYAA